MILSILAIQLDYVKVTPCGHSETCNDVVQAGQKCSRSLLFWPGIPFGHCSLLTHNFTCRIMPGRVLHRRHQTSLTQNHTFCTSRSPTTGCYYAVLDDVSAKGSSVQKHLFEKWRLTNGPRNNSHVYCPLLSTSTHGSTLSPPSQGIYLLLVKINAWRVDILMMLCRNINHVLVFYATRQGYPFHGRIWMVHLQFRHSIPPCRWRFFGSVLNAYASKGITSTFNVISRAIRLQHQFLTSQKFGQQYMQVAGLVITCMWRSPLLCPACDTG